MNRTVVFGTFVVLAALGLVGPMHLPIERPDATTTFNATFTSKIVPILGLVVSAARTFYALGKQNKTIEDIHEQTKVRLSKRNSEIERLIRENIELAK